MSKIELTTIINAPVARCFDLARSIDLHKISTIGTNEEAVAGIMTGLIGMGEHVSWRAKHFGITQHLTSEITAFQWPSHFRDEMLKGPFKIIVHDHLFERYGSSTRMLDIFEFESPCGVLGRVANQLLLTRYLRKLLQKRNMIIKDFAETEKWKSVLS
jgi:ligand-binding SRPBCC domain-containing protein